MKKIVILIALMATIASADMICTDMGSGMKICTDTVTGESTTIWTY